jgi:hypothetical protein
MSRRPNVAAILEIWLPIEKNHDPCLSISAANVRDADFNHPPTFRNRRTDTGYDDEVEAKGRRLRFLARSDPGSRIKKNQGQNQAE